MNYKDKLKDLREYNDISHKISQKEIADALNIKRSTYNQYEQQYDIIPIKRLCQVADFFKVSVDYILDLTNIKSYINIKTNYDIEKSKERIKIFRKDNNLTQEKLANLIKTDKSVVAHIERGRNLIATPFLYAICKKYNISADYLLGRTDNPNILK